MKITMNKFYEEDGGINIPSPTEGDTEYSSDSGNIKTNTEKEEFQEPKYFSQLPKEIRTSENAKALYKYQNLSDLISYIGETEGELKKAKESSKGMLKVPEKAEGEEFDNFCFSLGIPKDENEYELKSLKSLGIVDDETISLVQDYSKKALLTQKQAEVVGAILRDIIKNGQSKFDEGVKSFDERLKASHTELENESDRASASESDKKMYNTFLEETGLRKNFDSLGVSYNPNIVKAIAKEMRKISTSPITESVGVSENGGKKSIYSDSFIRYAKGGK